MIKTKNIIKVTFNTPENEFSKVVISNFNYLFSFNNLKGLSVLNNLNTFTKLKF